MANEQIIEARIRNKHDTDANFTLKNPVLLDGEIVFVMGSNGEVQMKVGDGVTNYVALPFTKLRSVEMTGTPIAPTASQNSNNSQVANTAFVYNEIMNNISLSVDDGGILSLSLY
mgnify:CR=1 FL=1